MVGLTAGASAPEELITEVLEYLKPIKGVEEVSITDEDEYFPPPRNLRDLIASSGAMASFSLGGPPTTKPIVDRQVSASAVLDGLTAR